MSVILNFKIGIKFYRSIVGKELARNTFGRIEYFIFSFNYSDKDFERKYIKIAMARKGFN